MGANFIKTRLSRWLLRISSIWGLALMATTAMAAAGTWGTVATTITGSFESLTKLITAGSYLAGLGFSIGAIMTFKQHKDNPTQVPIGKPIAFVFIAAALLFFPTVLGVTGVSIFGTEAETAGPLGTLFQTK